MSKMNNRVSETGASSYQQAVEANRRLREIKFTPQHCYIRGFLKYATTADTCPGKDAIFITDTLPSRVFLSELLGEPVYNPLKPTETETGYKVDDKKSCIETMTDICKKVIEICKDVPPTADESEFTKAIDESSELKLSWVQSYLEKIKNVLIQTRPEYSASFGIKEFCSLSQNFEIIIQPILKSMVRTFSTTRTDLITWVAKSQTVNINNKFSIGSIVAPEEDDGEMLDTCYRLATLSEDIAIHNFMQTDDGKVFPEPDMKSQTFRKSFRDWANVFKTGRIPWSRPTDTPIHFCIEVECSLDKAALRVDESTKQPTYSFGFYRSSLGESGKMNKIIGAAKLGTANDDPDFIQLFMGYTSSEDIKAAGQGMTVSDITIPGVTIFTHKQITDAFQTVAQDTYKRKVRLYDEFPLADRISDFRNYILKEKVMDYIDTAKHEEALAILGFEVSKTDAESLASGLYEDAVPSQSTAQIPVAPPSAFETAAIAATTPQPMPQSDMPQSIPDIPAVQMVSDVPQNTTPVQ